MTQRVTGALAIGALLVAGMVRGADQTATYVDRSGHQTSFVASTPDAWGR